MTTITIRHARLEDSEALYRIITGPQVRWGTLVLPFMKIEHTRERLSNLPRDSYWLVACVADEIVGSTVLEVATVPRRRHVGSIGIAVRDDWQGKGVGTELIKAALDLADNWLNLKRVELFVWTDNTRAIALYTKFGFVLEGTHRCHSFRDGHYVDAHAMARVRETDPA